MIKIGEILIKFENKIEDTVLDNIRETLIALLGDDDFTIYIG